MIKDKNYEKRYEYDLKITEVEQKSEELRIQERQLGQSLENFNSEITRSFQRLMEIEDELERRNHGNSGYRETEQKRKENISHNLLKISKKNKHCNLEKRVSN
ncbi:hypothetical protein AALM99_07705 [Lactococcus muris]|uniref:Uncharacterized protein n=1 Tax=Lactococcus muris TaxID=2941330 RepID=A0ABV4DAL0_9LACT